jgi:hypothetical protein
VLNLWIEHLCKSAITVADMIKIVRQKRIENQRREAEKEKLPQKESDEEHKIDDKYLAQITASSAIQMIQRAASPLNAARALFASLYCFILQLSSTVWSALQRAHREKEMERVSSRNQSSLFLRQQHQQKLQEQQDTKTTTPNSRPSSANVNRMLTVTSTKLPPLVAVRPREGSSNNNNNSSRNNTELEAPQRPGTSDSSSTHCDTKFLNSTQFELDHSLQKIEGLSRRPVKPIRTAFRRNIHDGIAAVKSDELRSHVPLVNSDSRDSSSSWELACLDYSDSEYPALARISQLQQKHGAEFMAANYSSVVSPSLARESEREMLQLCAHVEQVVCEIFESSPGFLAPAFTQCLVIFRGWFKNNNITNDFVAGSSSSSTNNKIENSNSRSLMSSSNPAAPVGNTSGSMLSSETAMCALLGVEPKVPGPYIVSIDGFRPVHIPHPLPSHTILVSNALRHQSQMRCEQQKYQLKLQRAKTEKILELQRASMRPRNDPRPVQHVAGRSRKAELGFGADEDLGGGGVGGDSSATLESILSMRYNSMTSSVLKRKKF